MSQITLNVPDISCAHCEKTVLGALQDKPGVKSVQVNIPGKAVYLDYDENAFSLDQVKEVLDEEGYPVAGTTEGTAQDAPRRNFIPLTGK
ncbi:MAG: heavy-metal-associated domain-containing protein [Chloroflexota bacterium]|jgi:copper chaperone